MYAQQTESGWQELYGNVVFSPNVYQTAESLSDEQRAAFGVYPVFYTPQPAFDEATQTAEQSGYLFDAETQQVATVWTVRDLTTEEKRARIPNVVSMRQGRLAMLYTPYENGVLLDVIEAMLNAIPDPMEQRAAKTDWEYATEIRRDFPLVQQLTSQLGMTEEQIDALFVLAASL